MHTEHGWHEYYEQTKDGPPNRLLIEALALCQIRQEALDLGAGSLIDSKYLLAQGFEHVTAVDSTQAPEHMSEGLPTDKFEYVIVPFDEFSFPENRYDLVSAQFSLPFNPPATFDAVFERIKHSLKHGGIFTGQLFGKEDGWNTPESHLTFHDKSKVEQLLSDMDISKLDEIIKDDTLASGHTKHKHLFNIIARKK